MKSNLKLLDCTLRDGGFVNNWRFGNLTMRSVVSRLDNAGIDIIECGFLDSRVNYDKDRTMFPDIPSIEKSLLHSLPRKAKLVAMIDFGSFNHKLIIPQRESVLDGIRLIFKKENIGEALCYAQTIILQGYNVFLNPVALTSYRDAELIDLIEKVNAIQPYGMSIVDTYGLMFNNDMEKYVHILDKYLHPNISLGYHSHNNLQMANAHCISFINKNLQRTSVIDSSVLGMGKNAGNACTELICSYLHKAGVAHIDIDQIYDCAFNDISKFDTVSNWGYGLNTLLSALHDCSPKWIEFLMSKGTLSVKGIREILELLPFEKRGVSYFSKQLAENKYVEYTNNHIDDIEAKNALVETLKHRTVLILCPGQTLITYHKEIDKYIDEQDPFTITVNFVTDMFNNYYSFISNPNRYSQMIGIYPTLDSKPNVFVTSNIVTNDSIVPDLVFNYKSLYKQAKGGNSACLLIALLKDIGVNHIVIAGMDGFDEANIENSFFNNDMQLGPLFETNDDLIYQLRSIISGNPVKLEWITPSQIKETLYYDES
jgi:4-hydroxy 2-oxovalerate aldolase